MRRLLATIAFLTPLPLLACGSPSDADSRCPELERLKPDQARSDALAATAKGDKHLIMLGGYVGVVPGGNPTNLPTVLLASTGDTAPEACRRLRPKAESYALAYNAEVRSVSGK
jgi:hypothetical protein